MIERLPIEDIDLLLPVCKEFVASTKFLKNFDMSTFCKNWELYIGSGMGIIFVSKDEQGKITGMIGGCKYPDPNNGELTATEFFWFVSPEHRGHGIKLFKAFEAWAKAQGCKKVIMVHLSDLMPEKVKHVYERFGYQVLETHYVKEVV